MTLRRTVALAIASCVVAASAVISSPAADAASLVGASKCVTTSTGVECVTIDSNAVEKWVTKYDRSFYNDLGQTVPMTCSETTSDSFKVSVSVTIKAELSAWVFAKIEGSVGTELTWEWTSSGTSKVGPVKVPDGWKYTCKFGTNTYTVKGHNTKYWSNGSVTKAYWSYVAPEDEKSWKWSKVEIG